MVLVDIEEMSKRLAIILVCLALAQSRLTAMKSAINGALVSPEGQGMREIVWSDLDSR